MEKLVPLIEKYGFINPIIIDKEGIIRAGHTRYKAAIELKLKNVPVLIYDFKDENTASAYAISDNKSSEWSYWDDEKLREIIEDLKETDFTLDNIGFSDDELEDLFVTDLSFNNLIDNAFTDYAKSEAERFTVSFTFDKKYKNQIDNYISKIGKEEITNLIIQESENYA